MNRLDLARRYGFALVLGAVATYAAVPVWAAAHPAIQDLPQHMAAIRVLASYGDPDLAFARYFTIDLSRTQYLAYYVAAVLLSWPFGVLVANKLLISASIIATPFAMRSLLRSLGADERLALFVIPLTRNAKGTTCTPTGCRLWRPRWKNWTGGVPGSPAKSARSSR